MKRLLDILLDYKDTKIPLHMPGHKRNIDLKNADYLKKLCAHADVTEAYGLDDLHNPKGIIKQSMINASKLWKAKSSYFLVNGSTVGNLAVLYALTRPKDKIIVARNCHKSVFHSIEICGVNPVYILPKEGKTGIFKDIDLDELQEVINQNPDAKLVYITSPTFEGCISDIERISKMAHEKGMKLVVDEAHGAHLGISDYFPKSAVTFGADCVIQSLHKTLPSLTQTAILHLNVDETLEKKIKRSLNIFETSSPSYLLMSSIDGAVNLIMGHKDELYANWKAIIERFYELTAELKHLKVLKKADFGSYDYDCSKLIISTARTNINGHTLSDILRNKYNIEIEMASINFINAYTGMGEKIEHIELFAKALLEIDKDLEYSELEEASYIDEIPDRKYSIFEAVDMDYEILPLDKAVGRVSADYIWAYPPGIPLIVPGEVIDKDVYEVISLYKKNGMNLIFPRGGDLENVEVIKKI